MTDQEKLAQVSASLGALKADIDAHLTPATTPIDEVVERVLVSSELLGECQPNNFKHAIETYEYRTVSPASNGGKTYDGPRTETVINDQAEPCVYVAPTGVIRYFVEIGNHDHSFIDVQAMKDWMLVSGKNVAVAEGGDPPCRLDYEVISGPKSFTFPTFTQFAAFIVTFVQTEAPPSNEPKDGPAPPEGWTDNLCLPVIHPEVRVYSSFQWHFNKSLLHDLDNIDTAHMHAECCIPVPGQHVGGLLKLDLKPVFFHMQGFLFREMQVKSFDPGAKVVSIEKYYFNRIIEQHVQNDWYVPAVIDMSGTTTTKGPSFRVDVLATRTTEAGREDHTLFFEVYDGNWLATGRKIFKPTGGIEKTVLPYLGARLMHRDVRNPNSTDPWPTPFAATDQGEWQIAPDGPVPLTFRAAWNADLHQHPPSYGTILSEGVFDGQIKYLFAKKPTTAVSGDRVMFRVADQRGVNEHGASAALIVLKVR